MAATFYTEPLLTFDVGIFVALPGGEKLLQPLAPLYDALKERGYSVETEYVMIEGVPVQFLPAYNALIQEALDEARHTSYDGVPLNVMRAEHLIAICIQTGREKDRERVRVLRDVPDLDRRLLEDLLDRHKLERTWIPWM